MDNATEEKANGKTSDKSTEANNAAMKELDDPNDEFKLTSKRPGKQKSKATTSDYSTEATNAATEEIDEPDDESKPIKSNNFR